MTDKCRRRMNGREEYITTEITQRKGGRRPRRRGRPRERKEAPVWPRGVGDSCPRARGPSPWDVGPPYSVCFSSPKQAVVLSEPNFWTHSLQIHCIGPGSKTVTLQVQKPKSLELMNCKKKKKKKLHNIKN